MQDVSLQLTRAEALVLFEWLTRFNNSKERLLEDQAEERVLWDLEAQLEKLLAEPFKENYDELLQAARASVRDP